MLSVAASHTSTRSNKSSKHGRPRSDHSEQQSIPQDVVEKLVVRTVDLQLEPNVKPGSPRHEYPGDSLAVMIGGPTRRSRCTPEFLLETSQRESEEIISAFGKKFRITANSEAVTFYKKFLGGVSVAEILGKKAGVPGEPEAVPYLVFAVALVGSRGKKVVDYFTTWHRKTSVNNLPERKIKFLDSQFRKTARMLDNEFRRVAIRGDTASVTGEVRDIEESITTKSRPPSILAPPPALKLDDNHSPTSPIQPASATDSVTSLPFLNMIRGVPLGHRVPLRIVNPDRLSMISSLDVVIQEPSPTSAIKASSKNRLSSIVEEAKLASITSAPFDLLTPEVVRTSRSSIRSSHSKGSAKSSAASTTSGESRRSKDKENVEFLIVLLENKLDHHRTWHGLERQVSKKAPQPVKNRVSLWDGPLARDSGITYSMPPIRSQPSQIDEEESSEEEEDWENVPVIPHPPPEHYRVARSMSEPLRPMPYRMSPVHVSPMAPLPSLGYGQSPVAVPAAALYPPSPYAPSYLSPYPSPVMQNIRSLSRSRYPTFGQP